MPPWELDQDLVAICHVEMSDAGTAWLLSELGVYAGQVTYMWGLLSLALAFTLILTYRACCVSLLHFYVHPACHL